MHTDYIRLFIYHSILGVVGCGYVEHKKTKFFHLKTSGKFRTSWLLLRQIICWHKNMIINAIPLGMNT